MSFFFSRAERKPRIFVLNNIAVVVRLHLLLEVTPPHALPLFNNVGEEEADHFAQSRAVLTYRTGGQSE